MLLKGFSGRQGSTRLISVDLSDVALDQIHDAVYLIDDQLNIRYVNDKACDLTGYHRDDLLYHPFSKIDPSLNDAGLFAMWWELSARPKGISLTAHHRCHNGQLIAVQVDSVHSSSGDYPYLLCIVYDISQLEHNQQLRQLREKQLDMVVENSPDLITRFDIHLRCIYANQAMIEYFSHYSEQESKYRLTKNQYQLPPNSDFLQLISQTLTSQNGAESELTLTSDGEKKLLHVRCVPEYDLQGAMISVLAVGRDITRLRQTEDELRAANQQLRLLASNRELTREVERKQLARDIHDELGQHLTSLRTGLSLLAMRCDEGSKVIESQIAGLIDHLDSTIQVVRDVSTRLRPNVLNLGLIPALEWLCDQFMKNGGCRCILIAPNEQQIKLDEASLTAAFRVVQESLTNAVRHAQAISIYVFVKLQAESLIIEVVDNGRGFVMSQIRQNAFGLLNLQERGRMLGGTVEISSTPGKGTRVKLAFPVPGQSVKQKSFSTENKSDEANGTEDSADDRG